MKKSFVFIILILFLALIWYLFVKPFDYKVTFTVKTKPGTVNQTFKAWDLTMDSTTIIKQNSIRSIEQSMLSKGHNYYYRWELNMVNDSTTKVEALISEPSNTLLNKITIPFFNTSIESDAEIFVKGFYNKIKEHLDFINVRIEGIEEVNRTLCAYTTIKTTQIGKAKGMMQNYPLLTSFVANHGLKPKGLPILEIIEWNKEEDSIKYNFCFPIEETDSLPENEDIKFKWLNQTKCIKAIYNGNYITSDRAWYELLHYAEKSGIQVEETPIEIYHNNPNLGGNEKEWRADVYLPIK